MAQDVWKKRRQARPQVRKVNLDYDSTRPKQLPIFEHLLPGGRWMLIGFHPSTTSAITYAVDLDSASPKLEFLFDNFELVIRDPERERPWEKLSYAFWSDRSSTRMFYRVAATVCNQCKACRRSLRNAS
jgi:hypothetical protein